MRDDENLTAERPTFVTHLECSATGARYAADELHNLSRERKPLLVRYDLAGVKKALSKEALARRPRDLWRYRELLPVRRARDIVSLGEPVTPIMAMPRLAKTLKATEILVKDESRLPTGSFKARGLALAVSMAKALRVAHMAMPTNGNAGAALAAYASRAGIKTTVFCPEDTPEVNVREIALQGATVYRVNGLIDDCGKIVAEGAAKVGWFDTSTLKEPYRIEGKKTMGLELAEQLGWEVPDVILYPTGGGTGLIGMWKAFAELEATRHQAPAHGGGAGGWLRSHRARLRRGRGARAALAGRPYHCVGHPGAAGDRRLSHLASGARERRLRDRGGGRRDYRGDRRGGARGRRPAVPGGRRNLCGAQTRSRRRANSPRGAGHAFQLCHRSQISAAAGPPHARPLEADRLRRAVMKTKIAKRSSIKPSDEANRMAECRVARSRAIHDGGPSPASSLA